MNRTPTSGQLRPLLLGRPQGPLTAFYHPPASHVVPRGDVLVVPAFAEEMNRCRSMVTMQSQALAALGVGTLVLDLHGTGDSAGDFDQGTWDGWRQDVQCGLAWLRRHGNGCRTLFGMRLGALMAAELAADDASIDRLLLWLPVVAGKPYWTQFLRLRIASDMGLAYGIRTTETLRQQSAQGQAVEASGYLVGSTLAQQIDRLSMPGGERLAGKWIAWFEVATNDKVPLSPPNAKQIEDWRDNGVQISVTQVVGPPFWLAREREVSPELIEATTAAVRDWPATPQDLPATSSVAPVVVIDQADAREYPLAFSCGDDELVGIVHAGAPDARLGVVIVVAGGPQYRAGAHRQFVSLARLFASHGYPVMRFDPRGMGDSSGQHVGYQHSRPDIRSGIDEFMRRHPQAREVVLFGECAAASGILFYASQDDRVRQIALTNPWVRTPEVQAEAILKHDDLDRRDGEASDGSSDFDQLPLPSKTAEGLRRFRGRVMLLMSGRDQIAREFDELTKSSKAWQGLLTDKRISRTDIADADHTFSKPHAKAAAQRALLEWLAGGAATNR